MCAAPVGIGAMAFVYIGENSDRNSGCNRNKNNSI